MSTEKPLEKNHKLQKKQVRRAKRLAKKQLKKKAVLSRKIGQHKISQHVLSRRPTYEELLNAESELGRTIFGPVPSGRRREFFKYKQNVWIWYEGIMGPDGVMHDMTVRYEVRPNGVYKRPGNGNYRKIDGAELDNFRKAAKAYLELVKTRLYY